ncbi:hypothetical protein EBESD8_38500 [Rhodococcus aetherivorans]|nr:hypothetical protein EBESD8_38500 [Rhodococcus aetherivorans]
MGDADAHAASADHGNTVGKSCHLLVLFSRNRVMRFYLSTAPYRTARAGSSR